MYTNTPDHSSYSWSDQVLAVNAPHGILDPGNGRANIQQSNWSQDIHCFWGLCGKKYCVEVAVDCRRSLIFCLCPDGFWALCWNTSHIENPCWNWKQKLSIRMRCDRKVAFVLMWSQTKHNQRVRTRAWSDSKGLGKSDRQSSVNPCHRWPMAMWSLRVQNYEDKEGCQVSQCGFYNNIWCSPETACGPIKPRYGDRRRSDRKSSSGVPSRLYSIHKFSVEIAKNGHNIQCNPNNSRY